jgi:hypothetical protein
MRSVRTTRTTNPRLTRKTALGWLILLLLVPAIAAAADGRTSPRSYIPAHGLIAYCEFEGLDAHADAWKATATSDMLSKTKAGAMIAELATRWSDWALQNQAAGASSGALAAALSGHVFHKGFVLAVHDDRKEGLCVTLVLPGIGRAEQRGRLDRLGRFWLRTQVDADGELPKPVKLRGRDVYAVLHDRPAMPKGEQADVAPAIPEPRKDTGWPAAKVSGWLEGEDLVLICTPYKEMREKHEPSAGGLTATTPQNQLALVWDTIDGKRPNVEKHPGFVAACSEGNDLKGFEAAGLYFVGPDTNQGLLIAFAESDPSHGSQAEMGAQGRENATPSYLPAPIDEEIRRAGASVDPLPPVLTEKDAEFMNGPQTSANASLKGESSSKPDAADDEMAFWRKGVKALGLDGIRRIAGRYGFQDRAFVNDLRVEAPSPRQGLTGWLDQPRFRSDRLPPLPDGVRTFAAGSIELHAPFQSVLGMLKAMDLEHTDDLGELENFLNNDLASLEAVLRHVRPSWCVFHSQAKQNDRPNGEDSALAGYALVAEINDREAFDKALDQAVFAANHSLLKLMGENPPPTGRTTRGQSPNAPFKRLAAPDKGYRLNDTWLEVLEIDDGVEPVLLVGKTVVVVAANLDLARQVLANEPSASKRWQARAELQNSLKSMPRDLTFLAVADHRNSRFPGAVQSLPWLAQFVANMSLDDDPANASAWCILDPFGIPRPGAFIAWIDPKNRPQADELQSFLFDSVVAATVDDRGYRLVTREPFPLALLLNDVTGKFSVSARFTDPRGLRFEESLYLTHAILDLLGSGRSDP